jgi:hypothetical protein
MGNIIKEKTNQIVNLTNLREIIDYKFNNYQLCKFNNYFIRIYKYYNKNLNKTIISIACEFSFFSFIREQLETLDYENLMVHFIINNPCYLNFILFLHQDKLCIKIKNPIQTMHRSINLLLENLPKNVYTLIINYDIYNFGINNIINIPNSLKIIKVKKNFSPNNKLNFDNMLKLPNNCTLLFI